MFSDDRELLVFTELTVNFKEAVITIKASDAIQQMYLYHDKQSRLLMLSYETEEKVKEIALARIEGSPILQQGGVESVDGRVSIRVSLEKCSLCSLMTSMKQSSSVSELCISRGGERLRVSCAFCGETLTREGGGRVKRIRPLPSEGWECMAEEWFCHPVLDSEGESVSPMENVEKLSLKPRKDDVFYTEMFYLLSGYNVCKKGSHRKIELGNKREGLTVTCEVCDQLLGSEYENWVELYQCQVQLKLSPLVGTAIATQVVNRHVERMVGQLCRKLRLEGHVCRVIVKPFEADPMHVILPTGLKDPWPTSRVLGFLWLLEPEWSVSVFSSRRGRSEYESGKVVQLMYLTRIEGRERIEAFPWELWLTDNEAYKLEIPYSMCQQLFQQLLRSSCLLPPQHKSMGTSMKLGFLRTV
ncbi:E3 ubiquitin-protein ligase E3D [Oopsacas minuta]|uniref:E3 ubiquitin-protein ligase E3D n=1 Tax=Oopsacas minuta TaxID=111878 RepID=A0AAV7JB83_9METZ|nr:E3 ubiquitin-protein ligase E3D [Oopsacas minuta]